MIGFLKSRARKNGHCQYCDGKLIISLAGAVTCSECHRHDEELEDRYRDERKRK